MIESPFDHASFSSYKFQTKQYITEPPEEFHDNRNILTS
jgi:hypothetical protein